MECQQGWKVQGVSLAPTGDSEFALYDGTNPHAAPILSLCTSPAAVTAAGLSSPLGIQQWLQPHCTGISRNGGKWRAASCCQLTCQLSVRGQRHRAITHDLVPYRNTCSRRETRRRLHARRRYMLAWVRHGTAGQKPCSVKALTAGCVLPAI